MSTSVRRRVGYFVENEQGTLDISVHSKNFEERHYQELGHYSKVIFDVKPVITAFEIVRANFEEIFITASSYKEGLKDIMMLGPQEMHKSLEGMVALTQRVSNFLASASLFLTNAEVRLGKMFGEDSGELSEWNERRRTLHKNSFSYRFMYELRNYSQHYGLPVSGFNINIRHMLESNPSINLTMYLSKSELIKSKFNWGKLKGEIEAIDGNSDIVPHLKKYYKILRRIQLNYLDLYSNKILECSEYISTFHKIFKIPEGISPVLFIGDGTKDLPPKEVEYVPTDQFTWVCSKYLELKDRA